jgi:hypothetical protein
MRPTVLVAWLGAIVVWSAEGAAQGLCGQYVNCGSYGDHQVYSGHPDNNIYDRAHNTCYVCVSGDGYPTAWMNCHSSCGGSGDPDPDRSRHNDDIEAAVAAGDVSELLRLANVVPDRIAYNAVRGKLQVSGCGGAIIASLDLPASGRAGMVRAALQKYLSVLFATVVEVSGGGKLT